MNFPFAPNGKFIIFRCPKVWANYSLNIMCSNIGTPNSHHFPFGTNGKEVLLGVPVLKHFRVTSVLSAVISEYPLISKNIVWTCFSIFWTCFSIFISSPGRSPGRAIVLPSASALASALAKS